jgi:cytoskeletal protein RodZ
VSFLASEEVSSTLLPMRIPANHGPMSRVADQLKAGREARNLTIEQVAEITKMRTDHIRALEQGDYKAFSAPVYIRGFVRTYARLLKIDERPILAELQVELGQSDEFSDHSAGARQSKGILDFATLQLSKLDWHRSLIGLTSAVLLVALIFGVIAWRRSRAEDPLRGLQPAVYKSPTNTAEILPLGGR